jgi:site-specific recombinase XerD
MAAGNSSKLNENVIKALEPRQSRYDVRDDKHSGLVLRVTPTGRKSWSLSYRNERGRQQRYTLGTWPTIKLDAARKLAKKKLGAVADDTDIAAERRQERQREEAPTVKEFIEGEYGNWMSANLRDADKGDYARFDTCLKSFLNKRLDRITSRQVDAWRAKRLNDGLSPATVNRDLRPLRKALTMAVKWSLIDEHPLKEYSDLKEPDEGRVVWLDDDKVKRLRVAMRGKKTPDYLRLATVMAMNTGLRKGEMIKLTWSAVDLDGKRLTVRAATSKGFKVRYIPLNKKTLRVLRCWRRKHPDATTVFNDLGEFKKSWNTLRDNAKLGDFRWHDFRHHFASKLVMAGIDLNTVRELLGHSDIRMTLRYAHLAPEHAAAAVEVL